MPMDPKHLQQIDQNAKDLVLQLDGWVSDLSRHPGRSADRYGGDVEAAYRRLKSGMGRNSDVLMRKIQVPSVGSGTVLVVSIDGLTDTQMVDQDIIGPLLQAKTPPDTWDQTVLTPNHISKETRWPTLLQKLAAGNTLVFAPGLDFVWVIDTIKYTQRAIERPQTELAVRGPEEAFNEIILIQKTQLRRRFMSPALQFRDVTIGRMQHITVSVAFLEGVANPALVETAIQRVQAITVDAVADSTTISGLIRDHPNSIFPTIRGTERVDIVARRLSYGAVAILTAGDPFVLIAPAPLADFYRTAMDYSNNWIDSSFVRLIRFVGWAFGLYLPAMYIALTQVNPSMLPTALFVVMQGSHSGLPFPPVVEILLMILVLEILRESAIRLPKNLSTTLGTVGAIVVGTAVVRAGLVDPQIIVIMTLTALSIFSTPVYDLTGTWRVVNFCLLFAGTFFGLLGIIVVTMMVVATITDMQSFGVPYFSPWAPFRLREWTDALLRFPWNRIHRRWVAYRPQRAEWNWPQGRVPRPHLLRGDNEASPLKTDMQGTEPGS